MAHSARERFSELVAPFHRSIKAHCYRMTGSLHEAEDLLQETLLRAWRSFDALQAHASIKAWLFQIATRVCLDAIAGRKRQRRILPETNFPPVTEPPSGAPSADVVWLEPYPDSTLDTDDNASPDVRYQRSETVRLAFVAALQHLPPRQRAVLLLTDVLGWSSAETATLIGGSLASVNSALQRARATLTRHYSINHPDAGIAAFDPILLDRYVRAWEDKDLNGFVELLREEATFAMPPWSQWYRGRESIRRFFAWAWKYYDGFRLMPTSANGSPAFGVYAYDRNRNAWYAHSVQVLQIRRGEIAQLTMFMKPLGPKLFPAFGIDAELPDVLRQP
jgi:RNA polymerase sigma-70 factor (ECF subfamily)